MCKDKQKYVFNLIEHTVISRFCLLEIFQLIKQLEYSVDRTGN